METNGPVIVIVELEHTEEHPFCSDMACPCHGEDGQVLLGELLASGQVADEDASAVFYGEKSL